ncbi:MAG: ester cyclase [Pseudomonadota bacterium]
MADIQRFAAALYDFDGVASVKAALSAAICRMPEPFGDCDADGVGEIYAGLSAAWPDFERRRYISITGVDGQGLSWVGEAGTYVGTFAEDWLGIPATRRTVHMRFHEFFRLDGADIVETQFGWDIPEVMMQAGAWPLAPSLGRDWCVPGPATCDGISPGGDGAAAKELVLQMLEKLVRHPAEGGPEVMELERYWHPKMHWYGPAGIGTARGIDGFRRHHQIPFLAAMPDRGGQDADIVFHFFAEGNYVGVTGWPNMRQTLSDAGWLGLPGVGREVTLKSLDFWRIENGLIRENWVLVDLIDLYQQLGIDVFQRMGELR